MAFKSGSGKAIGEINITPLVDVMLVLLVVFMVTTPIIVEEVTPRKVEVNLPTTNAEPVQREDLKRILIIYGDHRVMIDLGEGPSELVHCPPGPTQSACLEPLTAMLQGNQRLSQQEALFLLAERGLSYGFVVDVMARIKAAGFHRLGMVTNPPEGSDSQNAVAGEEPP